MPDKPSWIGNLDAAIAEFASLPWPWVDRPTVERVLRAGPRRAQQILQPCIRTHIGSSGAAHHDELIGHPKRLATSDAGYCEKKRRQRFSETLRQLQQDRPRLLVEAPTQVVSQQLANLPSGVTLAPGEIV